MASSWEWERGKHLTPSPPGRRRTWGLGGPAPETQPHLQGSLGGYAAQHSAPAAGGQVLKGCCPGRSSSRWAKAQPTSACWGSFERQREDHNEICSPHSPGDPQILQENKAEEIWRLCSKKMRVGKGCGKKREGRKSCLNSSTTWGDITADMCTEKAADGSDRAARPVQGHYELARSLGDVCGFV